MRPQLKPRFTYANVVASIALFGVLAGGGAHAASKIGANDIAKNAIRSKHVQKNAVKTPKLANRAVTAAKINFGSAGLIRSRKVVSNPGPNMTATPALLSEGGVTLTGSCFENGANQHTASVTVSGQDGVFSGISGGDWAGPQQLAANNLPSSAGTAVGSPSSATTHKLINLAVVTPSTTLHLNVFVGINLHGNDCVFSVSGTRA